MDLFATALPALADAWALILQPVVLGYLVLGVVMGLAVGIFPGLGGIAGLSLLLPFMFGIEPVYGLALMIGMVAVVPTSDTFSSVLMGIPGSSASQATVLDGFPLARKGQAARALSAAFTASLFGGLVGACFLTLFIVVARPLVLAFGLPEMLMISILGLSMVAVLAGRVALSLPLAVEVVPGITSLQALTAAHAIPLNEIGAPVVVTTGRRLRDEGWPISAQSVSTAPSILATSAGRLSSRPWTPSHRDQVSAMIRSGSSGNSSTYRTN